MEFSQLHKFSENLNIYRMKRKWRIASKGDTNSKVTDEDIQEVTFEIAKERVTDVLKEVDKNFDTHYNEPLVVRDIYSKKLKVFKNAEGFSDEERQMINSKIKFLENHIRKRLKEYDLENEPPTEETFKENELREIDSYKNAIKYSDFNIAKNRKEGGKPNNLYYNTLIITWKKNQLKDYKNSLQEFQDFLPDYLQTVYYVLGKTYKLFDFITRYEPKERSHKTVLNLKKGEIKDYLEKLENYNLDIRRIEIMKGKESALSLQKCCLLIYDEGLEALKQLGISVYKSPIANDFEKTRKKLVEACDLEQTAYQRKSFNLTDISKQFEKEGKQALQKNEKRKTGRKPAQVKPAQDYLINIEFEERKILFLTELKKLYKGCEPKTFNHLIIVLLEIDILKKATNKELKVSFEKAIEPKEQAQQNFDKSIRNQENGKDAELFDSLKRQVSTIIKEKQVV